MTIKPPDTQVKIIVLRAVSYTGSTWINLLLGTHAKAFSIGNPDVVLKRLRTGVKDICRVHAHTCPLWNQIAQDYDSKNNLFLELARLSKKNILIIVNPRSNEVLNGLNNPAISTLNLHLLRDCRPLAASYLRKNPDLDLLDVLRDWLLPGLTNPYFDKGSKKDWVLRYEDILSEPLATLNRLKKFTNLSYTPDHLRYWDYEHHIAVANRKTVSLIHMARDKKKRSQSSGDFYSDYLKHVEATGDLSFRDERWKDELSRKDLFFIDFFCGQINQSRGYDRDVFLGEEKSEFLKDLKNASTDERLSEQMLDCLDSKRVFGSAFFDKMIQKLKFHKKRGEGSRDTGKKRRASDAAKT